LDVDILIIKKVVIEDVFPNLLKLIQLGLTIPVSSATSERSFLSTRRIRIGLRQAWDKQNLQIGLLLILREILVLN